MRAGALPAGAVPSPVSPARKLRVQKAPVGTGLWLCPARGPNLAKVTTASADASPLVHVLVLPSQATPPSPSPERPPGAHAQPPPPHPVLSCSLVPHDVTHNAKHPHVLRTPTCPSPPGHDPWTPSLFPGTLDPFRSDHWTCPATPSLSPSVTGRLPSPAAWANLRPRLFPAPSPRGLSATPRQLGAMQLGQPCPGAARPLLPVSLSAASTPPASQGCPHLIPSPSQASCSTCPTSGPRALAGAAPLPASRPPQPGPFPYSALITGHRDMDCRTADHCSGGPGPARGSPLPQICAKARHGRARAHRAAAPLDPGLGAPGEAGWAGLPWALPAPPRRPRRFRSPCDRRGARTHRLGSTLPTSLLLCPTPSAHEVMRPRPLWDRLLLLWTLLNCGLRGTAQGPGEWTPWGSWSHCSSSCGRGLSVRSRRCIRFPGEELCWGDPHEYRLCQLPDCPPGAMPFRDLQCALYNGHPVPSPQKTYQWVPFYGAPNQCDLNCLAVGHAFYHSFGRVLDGTPCSQGGQGLCVAGRCLNAGCDGLMGSDAREDHCGRCGGANDSCLLVQRVFRDAGTFAGYWNVTLIPKGARHIRAAHRSRNHLALMAGDGHYVLNGNWAVSPPGTYEAAGTHVVYTRAAGAEETLRAAGPTSQDLLLQVLLQEPNPGIEFEFWLPRERYGPFQEQTQALAWSLRQPQPREVEPQPPETAAAPAPDPPRTPTPTPDPCPPCLDTRGRAHRLLHYCGSDFVFRARVLGRLRQAQETRYEVRVQLVYKNRSPLQALEYMWAPGRCPCPPLALHREYLLAAQRIVSPDGTQDRLLLPHAGYARPWSPAEDSRVRLAARRCPA